jgi:UDP-GlcNAc:undecaprenyl-phosphate/decaprenyl-phosphate GlcNAc-1-phosphate transferase
MRPPDGSRSGHTAGRISAAVAIEILVPAAVALLATSLATLLLRPVATRWGWVDRPVGRKRHQGPTPLVGGTAIAIGFSAGLLAAWSLGGASPLPVSPFAAALGVHLLGVVDDLRELSPVTRIGGELLAAAAAVAASGTSLLSELVGAPRDAVLAVIWLVTITNAINFLDASDGLACSVALTCAALLLASAWRSGQEGAVAPLLVLCAALAGFLVFNLPPASVFLGDGGSLPLGFLLAYFATSLTWYDFGWTLDTPAHALLAPLLVLAIPLYDLCGVVLLRLRAGVAPWRADERHFPHRLARRGLGPWQVLLVITACTLATGLGGVLLPELSLGAAVLVVAQSALVLLVLALLELGPAPRPEER